MITFNDTKFDFLMAFKIVHIMASLLHLLFLILFYVLGIYILVIFNIFSVMIYIFLVCTAKKNIILASVITYIEVYLHSFLCVYLIGWSCGFYIYPLCLIPVVYFISINMVKKGIYGHIIVAITIITYELMKIFDVNRGGVAPFQYKIIHFDLVLYIFNSASAIIVLIMLICAFLYEIRASQEELENKNKILENIANIDSLTGINNRRYMNKKIKEEIDTFKIKKEEFSIAICDIDDFKKINDTYGHDCGDIILKAIADILSWHNKKYDIEICRWGGEEFLILIKDNISNAYKICESILDNIRKYTLNYDNNSINVTITIGIAEFNIKNNNIEKTLKTADVNLYKGKNSTKNCIVIE